jgi:hypothetical protein
MRKSNKNNKHLLFGHQLNIINRSKLIQIKKEESVEKELDSKRISLVRLERPKTQLVGRNAKADEYVH